MDELKLISKELYGIGVLLHTQFIAQGTTFLRLTLLEIMMLSSGK